VYKFSAQKQFANQRGVGSPIMIVGILVIIIVVFLVATGSFKFNISTNSNESSNTTGNQASNDKPEMSEPKTYTNSKAGYTLQYPGDWIQRDETRVTAFYSPKEDDNDKFLENVVISADDVESQKSGITLDDLTQIWVQQNQKDITDGSFKMLDQGTTTIGGIPANVVTYTFTNEGKSIKGRGTVALKSGIAYVIVYTAEVDSYDQFVSGADMVISSFQLN
jgi:hypothetical protein